MIYPAERNTIINGGLYLQMSCYMGKKDKSKDGLWRDEYHLNTEKITRPGLRERMRKNQEWSAQVHNTVDAEHRKFKQRLRRENETTIVRKVVTHVVTTVAMFMLYVLLLPAGLFASMFRTSGRDTDNNDVLGNMTPRFLSAIDAIAMGIIDIISWPFRSKRERRSATNIEKSSFWKLRLPLLALGLLIFLTIVLFCGRGIADFLAGFLPKYEPTAMPPVE